MTHAMWLKSHKLKKIKKMTKVGVRNNNLVSSCDIAISIVSNHSNLPHLKHWIFFKEIFWQISKEKQFPCGLTLVDTRPQLKYLWLGIWHTTPFHKTTTFRGEKTNHRSLLLNWEERRERLVLKYNS